jgi:Rps23 Pro-64 3,4-dihydroxylase Tpa1-like proline 4-hydroxylase
VWRVDPDQLASAWRAATPFPHVVIDDVLAAGDLDGLMAILDDEPVELAASDIFMFEATAPEPVTAAFRAVRDQFAAELAPVFSRVGGRAVSRVDMRAYAYRPGHYLLPHTDNGEDLGRVYAYAFYLPSPDPPVDGELELFAGVTSATRIAPRANRLVVFEVSDTSLHQVREVLDGLRISLAGWFYT